MFYSKPFKLKLTLVSESDIQSERGDLYNQHVKTLLEVSASAGSHVVQSMTLWANIINSISKTRPTIAFAHPTRWPRSVNPSRSRRPLPAMMDDVDT